jgi:hypothetical protein
MWPRTSAAQEGAATENAYERASLPVPCLGGKDSFEAGFDDVVQDGASDPNALNNLSDPPLW